MPRKKDTEKRTFHGALSRLEEIIQEIESPQSELEASVKLYKEGVELVKFCGDSLNDIEKEVMILQQSAEGVFSLKSRATGAEPSPSRDGTELE